MNELNQKIENARQLYSIKFLNEQFDNQFDNEVRKEKLNKLLEKNDEKQVKTKQKISPR